MTRERFEKLTDIEQEPEEIREVLSRATSEMFDVYKEQHLDLVISSLDGKPVLVQDLVVDKIEGDTAFMTYIHGYDEFGELIPLELSRIKKAEIKK